MSDNDAGLRRSPREREVSVRRAGGGQEGSSVRRAGAGQDMSVRRAGGGQETSMRRAGGGPEHSSVRRAGGGNALTKEPPSIRRATAAETGEQSHLQVGSGRFARLCPCCSFCLTVYRLPYCFVSLLQVLKCWLPCGVMIKEAELCSDDEGSESQATGSVALRRAGSVRAGGSAGVKKVGSGGATARSDKGDEAMMPHRNSRRIPNRDSFRGMGNYRTSNPNSNANSNPGSHHDSEASDGAPRRLSRHRRNKRRCLTIKH